MGHITPFMDHYPRNEQMDDTDPLRHASQSNAMSIT